MPIRPLKVRKFNGPQPYLEVIAKMEKGVDVLSEKRNSVELWLLEHEAVVTCGPMTQGELGDIGIPVVATGRGGKATYHGPGQRVAYVLMPLDEVNLRGYVQQLEQWLIRSLEKFGLEAFTDEAGHGVWVSKGNDIAKIAAIGVRVRKHVAFHGIAVNVSNDLAPFKRFQPCGLNRPVTSLHQMGVTVSMEDVDRVLEAEFRAAFNVS